MKINLKIRFGTGLLTVLLASSLGRAEDLKPAMRGFLTEIQQLRPYLISEDKFLDARNEKEIATHLDNLKKLAESSAHMQGEQAKNYQPIFKILTRLVRDTERNFREGHKDLAFFMSQSTLHTCISCHTQLPTDSLKLELPKKDKSYSYHEARYLFATRQFDTALPAFRALILDYPKNNLDLADLMNVLEYSATIYARINRDPHGGAKFFAEVIKAKNLPPFLTEDLVVWQKYFTKWASEKKVSYEKMSDWKVIESAKKIIGQGVQTPFLIKDRSNHVAYLRASGVLHEFLQMRPDSPQAAQAYYLLGICYLTLNHDFFTSFDTLYLRTCVERFPKNPIARSCYKLLEEEIYLGYSGSSGTHVPADLMAELSQLRDSLDK